MRMCVRVCVYVRMMDTGVCIQQHVCNTTERLVLYIYILSSFRLSVNFRHYRSCNLFELYPNPILPRFSPRSHVGKTSHGYTRAEIARYSAALYIRPRNAILLYGSTRDAWNFRTVTVIHVNSISSCEKYRFLIFHNRDFLSQNYSVRRYYIYVHYIPIVNTNTINS